MRAVWIGLGVVVALVGHLFLGWLGSVAGGFLAGLLVSKRGWLAGGVSITVAWAILIAWNMAVASAEMFNMMETMGQLLGGMPGFVIPLATLLIAFLLGVLSGWLGASLRPKKSA